MKIKEVKLLFVYSGLTSYFKLRNNSYKGNNMWEKKTIRELPPPRTIKIWHWLCIMLFVFVCSLLSIIFIFPLQVNNNTLFIVILFCITSVITGILFSVRVFTYYLTLEKVKTWDEQIKFYDKQWQQWSMQSLAVLNSVIITPLNSSVDDFLTNQGEMKYAANKAFSFDNNDQNFYLESYEWIFANLADSLDLIDPKCVLTVILFSFPGEKTEKENLIRKAYKLINGNLTIEFLHESTLSKEPFNFDTLIDDENPGLYLIITDNTETTESSQFITALLLANESLYENRTHLNPQSYILRSMLTTENEYPAAVAQMHEIQPEFSVIKQIWYSQIDQKIVTKIQILLSDYGIKLDEVDSPNSHLLDTYLGYPNKTIGYWLALAFTVQAASRTQQTQLMATSVMDKLLLTTVTASLNNN